MAIAGATNAYPKQFEPLNYTLLRATGVQKEVRERTETPSLINP